ncbi:hypothetical protein LIER_35934 [Lithospermum erythrorhizon]|uniref:Trichome birefringence-like N-terminal domain-containing protein n=1 Tax=Lithospermum erythrorhizon TaxID=34254 RepID=A0AAV3P2H6_LITER
MRPFSNNINHNHFSLVFVKFAICFLFLGLAYRLISSSFVQFAPVSVSEAPFDYVVQKELPPSNITKPPVSDHLKPLHVDNQTSYKGEAKCNIFVGDWIRDSSGPLYTNNSCNSIELHQNCMKNGRPDRDYLNWRWKPKGCELPRFNPTSFLELMKDKSMAFIGDSIMRNHVQSLFCTISQIAEANEVYHDEHYRSKRWHVPSYNFTLSVVWSPYMTKSTTFEDDNGVSTGITQLHLDMLDSVWTQQYDNFDYVVVAGGKWFLKSAIYYEKNTIVGCHNCKDKNITQLGFYYAYRKAINSVLSYIMKSNHKVNAFFRTTTPDHFENGEWDTGGYCNRTRPFEEGEVDFVDIDQNMRKIELEEFQMASAAQSDKGLTLKLFDTAFLSLLRPDGHPGVYRQFQPYAEKDKNVHIQNDCLHWCLPGPIDSWNELMLEMLMNDGKH